MLAIVCWLWGSKYPPDDVRKLARGVARHLEQPHKFFVVTDGPGEFEDDEGFYRVNIADEDRYLLGVKGCFARLRMFNPEWQAQQQFRGVERFGCIDLDVVVAGPLDPLFNRPENFVILQGANAVNPCPFNGSLMMLRAGAHPEVWTDFSLDKAKAVPFFEFPDDQGWLHHKLPNASGWKVGSQSGVYAFQKPGWPGVDNRGHEMPHKAVSRKTHPQFNSRDDLPTDARLVVFPGWRSPEKFKHLKWIKENWV